jgi:glycosyltransferase involved in cell wall biosynthesis
LTTQPPAEDAAEPERTRPERLDELRIAYVCGGDFQAPSQKHLVGFAHRLTARGAHVLIAMSGDPSTAISEGVTRLPSTTIVPYAFVGPRLRRRAMRAVVSFKPTLIHAFNSRLPVIRAASALAQAAGAPMFVHFEDDEWSLYQSGRTSAPRRVLHAGARVASLVYPPVWPYATAGSLRATARDAIAIDALTPALAAHVEERLGRSCAVVLPAMAAPQEANPPVAPHGPPPQFAGRDIILYTGNVYSQHIADMEIALHAVAIVCARHRSATFVHLGHVSSRYDLPATAARMGVPEGRAFFLGYVPYPELHPFVTSAAVAVQPGRPTEFNRLRLPSKVHSYLKLGAPTVTFATGFGELLEDRREVLKTYTDRPEELAERILEILEDEHLAQTLRQGAARAAKRLFDDERNTEALLSHYRAGLRVRA